MLIRHWTFFHSIATDYGVSNLWCASESAHTMGRADRATWEAMGSRWIMKLRHMTAEVVELEDVVIEENRHGDF